MSNTGTLTPNQVSILRNRLEAIFLQDGTLKEIDAGFQIELMEPWPFHNPEPGTYRIHWSAERVILGEKRCPLKTGWEIVKFNTPGDVVEDVTIL